MRKPEKGDVWQHYNGTPYIVIGVANLPDNERYPETVVYRNRDNHSLWARPLSDWHRSMTFTGEQLTLG